MNNKYLNEMTRFIGIFIMIIIALLAIAALIYGLLGYIDDTPDNPQRIVATLLLILLPIAYLLGRREGKAHREGVERGVNIKIGAARPPAPARIITPSPAGVPQWQSIVPPSVDINIKQSREDDVVVL